LTKIRENLFPGRGKVLIAKEEGRRAMTEVWLGRPRGVRTASLARWIRQEGTIETFMSQREHNVEEEQKKKAGVP